MAIEIERKFRVHDFAPLRARLTELGGVCDGAFLESNVLLDTADHRLRDSGCGLRIRKWQTLNPAVGHTPAFGEITFKGPLREGTARIREELEVSVGDPHIMADLLESLGFHPQIRYLKRRERWRCAGKHVELDTLPLLGTFAEIEGDTLESVDDMVRKLGLPKSDEEPRTYVAMLFEECEKQGIDPLKLAAQSKSALGVV